MSKVIIVYEGCNLEQTIHYEVLQCKEKGTRGDGNGGEQKK